MEEESLCASLMRVSAMVEAWDKWGSLICMCGCRLEIEVVGSVGSVGRLDLAGLTLLVR